MSDINSICYIKNIMQSLISIIFVLLISVINTTLLDIKTYIIHIKGNNNTGIKFRGDFWLSSLRKQH